MSSPDTENPGYAGGLSSIIVPLLKGVIYRESGPDLWNNLLTYQAAARDYIAVLGLELIVDEAEGYAFLRSRPMAGDNDDAAKTPRLVARRPLSFPVSLLVALLRKKLAEFDASGGDTRLVLTKEAIVELIRIFLPQGTNETRFVDRVESDIKKIAEMEFIRPLRGQNDTYEVCRIIKAYVDAQWLAEFEARLAAYRAHVNGEGEDRDD